MGKKGISLCGKSFFYIRKMLPSTDTLVEKMPVTGVFFSGGPSLQTLRTLYVTRDTWVPQKHNWQSKVTFDTLNTEMILTKHSPEIFNDQPLTKGNQNHQGVESNLD